MPCIEDIVKSYFDNAIIIDDELFKDRDKETENKQNALSDKEKKEINKMVDANPDFMDMVSKDGEGEQKHQSASKDAAVSSEFNTPDDVFKEFAKDGFIVLPYKFESENAKEEQINFISKAMGNAKFLLVDWNLENAKDDSAAKAGDTANAFRYFYK